MGAQPSKMVITTERRKYFVGEIVRGAINLHVQETFTCNGVGLSVYGEENTKWHTSGSSLGANHVGRGRFFEVKVVVHNFGGTVNPGQYSFPFEFTLQQNLPASFDERRVRRGVHASIVYLIKGACEVNGLFSPNIKHVHPFEVVEKINPVLLAPLTLSRVTRAEECCCFSSSGGEVRAAVSLEKSAFYVGETMRVACAVDNPTPVEFSSIVLKLACTLTLRCSSGQITVNTLVAHHRGPGVAANTTGQNLRMELVIPPHISPSVRTKLISCTYTLICLLRSSGVCATNVAIRRRVCLFSQQAEGALAPYERPPEWLPTVFSSTNIVLPAADLPPSYEESIVDVQPSAQDAAPPDYEASTLNLDDNPHAGVPSEHKESPFLPPTS